MTHAAALVVDGQLVAAVEEERFNRIKHWAGFPAESIRYCLDVGGIAADQLDHVAISFNPKANFAERLGLCHSSPPQHACRRRSTETTGQDTRLGGSVCPGGEHRIAAASGQNFIASNITKRTSRPASWFLRTMKRPCCRSTGWVISPARCWPMAPIKRGPNWGEFTSRIRLVSCTAQ